MLPSFFYYFFIDLVWTIQYSQRTMRQQALTPIAKEECHQQRRAARKRKYNYNNKNYKDVLERVLDLKSVNLN